LTLLLHHDRDLSACRTVLHHVGKQIGEHTLQAIGISRAYELWYSHLERELMVQGRLLFLCH
jgi:hypothetical protein